MAEEENQNLGAQAAGTPVEVPAAEEKPVAAPVAADKPVEAPAAAEKPAEGDGGERKDKKPRDIFAELAGAETEEIKIHKAKKSKHVTRGIVHIIATFNNTVVTVTDSNGNTIGWSTAGKMGFKGSRKSTAYAAQVVSQDACRQAMGHGMKEAEVRVKGPGSGREAAVRAVQGIGIEITAIRDVTPIPHNGCRPKKARRV